MRRSLVAALALAATAVAAPGAQAHPDYDYRGGCFLVAVNDEVPGAPMGGPTSWSGYLGSVAVATLADGTRPAPNASITVTCEVYRNGDWLGAPYVSAHKGLGATRFGYLAEPDDVITVCAVVDVEGEVHDPKCSDASQTPVVPGPAGELIGLAHGEVHGLACYAIAIMAPGLLGVVEVTPEGDVTVGGTKVYDCPTHDSTRPADPLKSMFALAVQE